MAAAAPQTTTMPKIEITEIYYIHTVEGREVEAIKIGLDVKGIADLSGLAGKRDDLKESLEGFGTPQAIGPTVFPKDGARFLKALLHGVRSNPYHLFRKTPELR